MFRLGKAGAGLLPRLRPLVLGAGFHRSVDVRHADAARRTSRRSRSSTRGRACSPRCRARRRRPKRCCSRRCRRPRASTRTVQGAGGRVSGRRAAVPADRDDDRSQRAVNTDKDIIKVGDLYYMCFQGVWFMSTSARPARGRSTGDVPKADLRDPGQLAVAQRHLRHRRKTTATTRWSSRRPRPTPA